MAYSVAVARKQIMVELDEDMIQALDRIADREATTRSDLLRRGARAVMLFAEWSGSDTDIADTYRKHPEDAQLIEAVARQIASKEEH